MPRIDATIAGRDPHTVATNRMISRKARATVVGLMCSPSSFNSAVTMAMPTKAEAKPTQVLRHGLPDTGNLASDLICQTRAGRIHSVEPVPNTVGDRLGKQTEQSRVREGDR